MMRRNDDASPGEVEARLITVGGLVHGVGFRPFLARLAAAYGICGWAMDDRETVRVHVEGITPAIEAFLGALTADAPPASRIGSVQIAAAAPEGFVEFSSGEHESSAAAVVPIDVDSAICEDCLRELRDPLDRRFGYPYISCNTCGPRYSIVRRLPYARQNTTAAAWEFCEQCELEYEDTTGRRYQAAAIACGACGPHFALVLDGDEIRGDAAAVEIASEMLTRGAILGVKGIGGFDLACDAASRSAVATLQRRTLRGEEPLSIMARDLAVARELFDLKPESEALLVSDARPAVFAPVRKALPGAAGRSVGVMLPSAPIHFLLFDAGAPAALRMTGAGRYGESSAYADADAIERLRALSDGILIGERPIARRIGDSAVAAGPLGVNVLRRARGYAPGFVCSVPANGPILAVGGDLQSAVALLVDGMVIVSQHLGNLDDPGAMTDFESAIADLLAMYRLSPQDCVVAHDLRAQYRSTAYALSLGGTPFGVQHQHAHVASALAEHGLFDAVCVGLASDGIGLGTDGTWKCEVVTGSIRGGFGKAGEFAAPMLDHDSARALAGLAGEAASMHGTKTIVLAGGLWQNSFLVTEMVRALRERRLDAISNRAVPVNGGGISLGQAAIAACTRNGVPRPPIVTGS